MVNATRINWPPLDVEYTDEFGLIAPEVYAAAGQLWLKGEKYALSTIGDGAAGLRLMIKAAALVSRRLAAPDHAIENLGAYLFQTYKHLLLAEMERRNGHRQRDLERHAALSEAGLNADAEELERRILLQQIVARMDGRMRETFELLTLGYSFEEIGRLRRENGHALRTKFNKQLKQLVKHLNPDS
ncbi:MAG: hypothetical protein QOJ76_3184 [Acidobacteriota bacterium]|jgi:hypothetical protein|nr:hypothetical protein [Acidobacteriota bacterium]